MGDGHPLARQPGHHARLLVQRSRNLGAGTPRGGVWAWAWPNIDFNIYASGLMMERMSPVGPAHRRLDYLYLMPEGEAVSAETLAMSHAVLAEDKGIVERVQDNLNAGIYQTGRLSPKHEGCITAFQAMVRQALAAPLARPSQPD